MVYLYVIDPGGRVWPQHLGRIGAMPLRMPSDVPFMWAGQRVKVRRKTLATTWLERCPIGKEA